MKKIFCLLAVFLTVMVSGGGPQFLTLADATGGAQTGFFLRAAMELSMTGRLNLSMARKLPSEAMAMLERGEVEAVFIDSRFVKDLPHTPIAAEALALYVSNANPAANLTKAQALEILTARRPGWKNYLNIDFDIQRIAIEPLRDGGTLIQRIFGQIEIDPEIFSVDSMSSGFSFINTASLFYAPFSPQPPMEVKMLSIDGILPTTASVTDGSYPLTVRYVLVYKELTPKIQALLYLLKQNQYRRRINDSGLIVLLEE